MTRRDHAMNEATLDSGILQIYPIIYQLVLLIIIIIIIYPIIHQLVLLIIIGQIQRSLTICVISTAQIITTLIRIPLPAIVLPFAALHRASFHSREI
uniref:Uncharacterized protein n=1 Tax=Oryza glumipatula TaxID=40148 RepID=A0A0E0AR85_9ORYZ